MIKGTPLTFFMGRNLLEKLVNSVSWDCIVNLSQGPRQKSSEVVSKNKYQEAIVLEPHDVIQDLHSVLLHVLLHVDVEAGGRVVQEDALQRSPLAELQNFTYMADIPLSKY